MDTTQSQLLCKICKDNYVSIIFVPCGHLITCIECSYTIINCLSCNQEIHALVKADL